MKKVLAMVAFVMLSVIVYAFNDKPDANQGKKEVTGNGEVVVMDKEMFLKDVFDYEKSKEWKYKGDKPAIIDLYADSLSPDSPNHERIGKGICRENNNLQSQCRQTERTCCLV